MFSSHSDADRRAKPLSLCHILCLCAIWIQLVSALPQAESSDYVSAPQGGGDLIGSIPNSDDTSSTSAAPAQTTAIETIVAQTSEPAAPQESSPPPSVAPPMTSAIPTQAAGPSSIPNEIGSVPTPPEEVGSAPQTPGEIGSAVPTPVSGNASLGAQPTQVTESNGVFVGPGGSMQSSDAGLKPIPPAVTDVGNSNGRNEVTAPNFTGTKCQGCQPVIEVTRSGWGQSPAEEIQGERQPPPATIPVGSSNVIISQQPGGGFVLGGSTTAQAGQTVTVDDTPIVIQTSAGWPEVVVGSNTIQMPVNEGAPLITGAAVPLPPVLTIGTKTIMPDEQTRYIFDDQTLAPGGPAITVSGTVLSLAPSATALVVNGEVSAITPEFGNVYTTQIPAALTFHNQVYTTNRAGYIVLGPGTTLIPGGSPVTVDGTVLSFEHAGTAVIVQGTTSQLAPVTTVVTLTRGLGLGGGVAGATTGSRPLYPEKPISGGVTLRHGFAAADGWFTGILILSWWVFGLLAARL